jgi:hypothetical protein
LSERSAFNSWKADFGNLDVLLANGACKGKGWK